MCELEITQTVLRFGREDHGSVVYGIMKENSTVLGKLVLSIPYRSDDQKTPYWIIIWEFEISPEHQHKGFGRACYLALEKMILEKYHPQEIYLQYLSSASVAGQPSDSKGFWEKLGYTTTHDQTMKKRVAVLDHA
jgi:GNAT superfamily N-acetyltransferase